MQTADTLELGQEAPEFTLRGAGGQPVSLSDYRGQKNVVIAFYPLAFSPVCSHQLPALEKELPRFAALDTVLLGVSVDSWYANQEFAKQLGVSFPLLSDLHRKASLAYGVFLPERAYSGRALFAVDRKGTLVYKDVTPTPSEVPSHEALLAALARLS